MAQNHLMGFLFSGPKHNSICSLFEDVLFLFVQVPFVIRNAFDSHDSLFSGSDFMLYKWHIPSWQLVERVITWGQWHTWILHCTVWASFLMSLKWRIHSLPFSYFPKTGNYFKVGLFFFSLSIQWLLWIWKSILEQLLPILAKCLKTFAKLIPGVWEIFMQ